MGDESPYEALLVSTTPLTFLLPPPSLCPDLTHEERAELYRDAADRLARLGQHEDAIRVLMRAEQEAVLAEAQPRCYLLLMVNGRKARVSALSYTDPGSEPARGAREWCERFLASHPLQDPYAIKRIDHHDDLLSLIVEVATALPHLCDEDRRAARRHYSARYSANKLRELGLEACLAG